MKAAGRRKGRKGVGLSPSTLLACTVSLLALPSAVLAFSSNYAYPEGERQAVAEGGAFIPAAVDARQSRSITVRALAKGKSFRFTPATTPSHLESSVTVAVRLDGHAMGHKTALALQDSGPSQGLLGITPTAYNLGAKRGYKGFTQTAPAPTPLRQMDMPDLASFAPSGGAKDDPARFSPRIALDEREQTGRSPRTLQAQDEARVDVGGSYRVSRNINVTAGVRYQQERDRLKPITDGKQDSQAVYVGTQFRF